jgi:predicted translin family RNA/ssDNA-binding protein
MDNSTFFREWKGLPQGRRDDFSRHLVAWAGETGADRLSFIAFGERHYARGKGEDFLRHWNAHCEANWEDMVLGKDFVPRTQAGKDRCDAKWLAAALAQLDGWWGSFRVLETLRASSYFPALAKLKSTSVLDEFAGYLKDACPGAAKRLKKIVQLGWEAAKDSTSPELGGKLGRLAHDLDGLAELSRLLSLLHDKVTTFLCRRKLRSHDFCLLLDLLQPDEHADFLWWVTRPRYREHGKELPALAALVLEQVIVGKGLCKEELFHMWLKGKRKYDAAGKSKLARALGLLAKTAEDYLAQAEEAATEPKRSIALLGALNRRGGAAHFMKHHVEAVEALKPGDETYYEARQALEVQKVQYEMGTSDHGQKNIHQNLITFAAEHAVVVLTRLACDALGHQLVSGIQPDLGPVRLLQTLAQMGLPLPQLAKVFQQAWLMLEHPQEKRHLQNLLDLLRKKRQDLGHDALRRLYKFALNVCMVQVNLSRHDYKTIMDQIFQDTLPDGLLLQNGVIEGSYLRNIIIANVRNGDIEAAKAFYEEYKDKIAQINDPSTPDYLAAMIAYYAQPVHHDYVELIKTFGELASATKNEFLKIDAWVFRFRIAIDNGDWAYVIGKAHNFRMRIERYKSILPEQAEKYQHFRRYTARLAEIQEWLIEHAAHRTTPSFVPLFQEKAAKLRALMDEVAANGYVVAYDWLKAKIQAAMADFPTLPPELGA